MKNRDCRVCSPCLVYSYSKSDKAVQRGIIGVIDRRKLLFQLGTVLVEKSAQFIQIGKLIPKLCVDNTEQNHRVIGKQACHGYLHQPEIYRIRTIRYTLDSTGETTSIEAERKEI